MKRNIDKEIERIGLSTDPCGISRKDLGPSVKDDPTFSPSVAF